MSEETLIADFLDRIENAFSAGVETCESSNTTIHALKDAGLLKESKKSDAFDYETPCTAHGVVEFDRAEARKALDRLFLDLKDFASTDAKPTNIVAQKKPASRRRKGVK